MSYKYDSYDHQLKAALEAIPKRVKMHVNALMKHITTITDKDGRLICQPFMDLPMPPSEHAEYYTKVNTPMSFQMITDNIAQAKYSSVDLFVKDVRLLIRNVKMTSAVKDHKYIDVCSIEDRLEEMLATLQNRTPKSGGHRSKVCDLRMRCE
eukprot:m.699591 g.699591  ORF g.699591 m.699591 type:complete len:152 (+) comp22905_c1_seq10:1918-2373(+)